MVVLEDFKAEVEKYIHFMNERLKTYHLDTEEEYDDVIDNLKVEYFRSDNKSHVFQDMECYEEEIIDEEDEIWLKNHQGMTHACEDEWGQPIDKRYPRIHQDYLTSADGSYDASITTLSYVCRAWYSYLYKNNNLSNTKLFIPYFFIERITDNAIHKYHYEIRERDLY